MVRKLISCPRCGGAIAATASTCPHCGHGRNRLQGGCFGLFVLFALLLLAAALAPRF
jgi:hypothetical protein